MDSKRDDVKARSMGEMVVRNALTYGMPDSTTLVDSRSMKRYYAQRDQYGAGDTMVFQFGTGTDYIHGMSSYLTFSFQSLDDATPVAATFGGRSCTALNLFNNVTLKNGEVIDREEALNVRSVATLGYEEDPHFHATQGQIMGATGHGITQDFSNATQICIPLNRLMAFFDTDRLIPSQIIAGARLEIRLEDAVKALVYAIAPTGTARYIIDNPSLMLDSYNLTDSARLFLEKRASGKTGLSYVWKAWEHANVSVPTGINRVSAEIGRPVSDAVGAVAKIRPSVVANEVTNDSFVSQAWDETTSTRFKLGSLMFPDQKVESGAEQYQLALKSFDKMRGTHNMPHNTYGEFLASEAVVSMSFERHHAMKLSGLHLNQGGRSLSLDWQVDANATNLQIDAFMSYVRVASGFSDGSIVVQF
jgi:hypothetical protein